MLRPVLISLSYSFCDVSLQCPNNNQEAFPWEYGQLPVDTNSVYVVVLFGHQSSGGSGLQDSDRSPQNRSRTRPAQGTGFRWCFRVPDPI